jgi:hypothetical protein
LARQALDAREVADRYRLLAANGESRVDPAQRRAMELLRQPLGTVQALEQAAEDLSPSRAST